MTDRAGGGDSPETPSPDGMTYFSYLLGGAALWGGVGWLADRALGLDTVLLPTGVLLGLVAAIYLIVVQTLRS